MKNKALLIVIAIILVAAIVVFGIMYFGKKKVVAPTGTGTGESEMSNLALNFPTCTPTEVAIPTSDEQQGFTASILGIENGKCHYKLTVGVNGIDCYFPMEQLDSKLFNQVFGNEEGLSDMVSQNCTQF